MEHRLSWLPETKNVNVKLSVVSRCAGVAMTCVSALALPASASAAAAQTPCGRPLLSPFLQPQGVRALPRGLQPPPAPVPIVEALLVLAMRMHQETVVVPGLWRSQTGSYQH